MRGKADNQIGEIIGALTDPIIVMPGGWGEILPDWIKSQITLERLAQNARASKGEKMTATDAEACAYLYTASLEAPMSRDWAQVYFYVTGKAASWDKDDRILDDIRVDSLDDYQVGLLKGLKDWIYECRLKARKKKKKCNRQ